MSVQHTRRFMPYSCGQLFALVLDIEKYPEFVPGYRKARIICEEGGALTVEQEIGFGPATFRFRSRAEYVEGQRIFIHALDGPFRRFEVDWHFEPGEQGCQVTARTRHEPGLLLGSLFAGGMQLFGSRLLDAFARRAASLHSSS